MTEKQKLAARAAAVKRAAKLVGPNGEPGPWSPGGPSPNPAGAPKHGTSWSYVLRQMQDMTAEEITQLVGVDNDLGRMMATLPQKVAMKHLIGARTLAALMFEPDSGLWTSWMNRAEGPYERVSHGEDAGTMELPARLLSSSFVDAWRDVAEHRHFEYLFHGGRGSLKSTTIANMSIVLMVNNPEIHMVALRRVGETLRQSVYAQLTWSIHALGLDDKFQCLVSPLEITYLPTGQKIFFRGADQEDKIKSIKPTFGYIGIGWFEELDQFAGPEAVRKIEQSIFRGGPLAWDFKSYNPPKSEASWVNKYRLIPKDNQLQHESNYLDVPPEWLGQVFLDEALHLKEVNEAAYNHEYMGVITGSGGTVFDNVHSREMKDEEILGKKTKDGYEGGWDRIYQGIDFGFFPDPFAWTKMYYDAARTDLYIFDELRLYRTGNRAAYEKLVKDKNVLPGDAIVADSAEPKSIADLRSYGLSVRGAEKGPDSVDYSMKWLQSRAHIFIDPRRAPESLQEFTAYEYEKNKDDEWITGYPDLNNHFIDSTRYAMNLTWRRRGE